MPHWATKFDDIIHGGPTTLIHISSKAASQYFGRTATTSSTLGPEAVVSTQLIGSASLVFFNVQNNFSTGSGPAFQFAVATIGRDGTGNGFFRIAAANSVANVGSWTVMFEVVNPQKLNPST